MQSCGKCGNKEVPDNSKYCNRCGTYLKLARKQIQFKENKTDQLKSLKKTLIEGSKIIDEDENRHLSTSKNIYLYQSLVLSYLNETTNFKDVIRDKISENEFKRNIFSILNNVKRHDDEDILNEFLVEINEIFESSISKDNFGIKFVFYTNIELRTFIKDKFCEMLELFNLKVFNQDKFKFENDKLKKYFKTDYILLEYISKGKDVNLMKKDASDRLYLFFGYLTFLHRIGKRNYRDSANLLSLDYNLSDIHISTIIELNADNSFVDERESYYSIKNAETFEKSELIKFTNNELCYELYKILMESENKRIIGHINEYLILYYKASIERDLDISFLKFWTLSEKIIKNGNKMSDNEVLKYMRKILEHYGYPPAYQERIYYVKEKRNKLIHEHLSEITQDDRNVIKSVCDNLIWFLMEFEEYVKDMDEYKIFLNYFNKENGRLIEILNLIENIKRN